MEKKRQLLTTWENKVEQGRAIIIVHYLMQQWTLLCGSNKVDIEYWLKLWYNCTDKKIKEEKSHRVVGGVWKS